jgi:hypothetical protein
MLEISIAISNSTDQSDSVVLPSLVTVTSPWKPDPQSFTMVMVASAAYADGRHRQSAIVVRIFVGFSMLKPLGMCMGGINKLRI